MKSLKMSKKRPVEEQKNFEEVSSFNQNYTEDRLSAEAIIEQLKEQLEITQSQNMAYAKDLAKLYQLQRADARAVKLERAKISHTDRLALMGQLAAGVAHDLSNLIGPILGYSQIILRQRDSIDPTIINIIERILATSRRANVLLRQMITLSKTNSKKYECFDLNEHIKEILQILNIKIRDTKVDLLEDYTENQAGIYGNPIEISQVVLNVVINAVDAMPAGGTLTIKTSFAIRDNQEFVQLEITDTGVGILSEDLPHIFETFYTTKAGKSGTGLGLSVTRQIVDDHGGQILVDSTAGKGTTFTILLPSQEKDVE
jgi:signal transduction histidine kinase